jgi:hypothetical protein
MTHFSVEHARVSSQNSLTESEQRKKVEIFLSSGSSHSFAYLVVKLGL